MSGSAVVNCIWFMDQSFQKSLAPFGGPYDRDFVHWGLY